MKMLGTSNFKASEGWLYNFTRCHSVQFKRIQGEAGNIDIGALNQWQQEVLHIILASFSPNDVFNADDTGLIWQLLPDKILAFKDEKCTTGKKGITVLVGANMACSEKLPLFVIGKSLCPLRNRWYTRTVWIRRNGIDRRGIG